MLAYAQSGETVFAACLRLFHSYPLAVRRHYAEHRYGSMVMMSREAGTASFFVLIMERDDLFAIRPWDRRDWARVEIRPREPVDESVRRLIGSGVPVLRDGVLLGWVAGQQVRAVLAAHGRLPEPWDDASVVPGTLVMPRVGSQPAERPPLTGRPLDDGKLWDYIARGQLTDLTPLVSRQAGRVFWVPGVDEVGGRRVGRLVVTERLHSDDSWLPGGRVRRPVGAARGNRAADGQPAACAARGHRSFPQLRAAVPARRVGRPGLRAGRMPSGRRVRKRPAAPVTAAGRSCLGRSG